MVVALAVAATVLADVTVDAVVVVVLLMWFLVQVPPSSEAAGTLAPAHSMPRVLWKTCALEHHTLVRSHYRSQA